MSLPDVISTAGVTLILVAFFMLSINRINPKGTAYNLLNLTGAGLATIGAYMIRAYPFVALEGIWATVALISLVRNFPGRELK